ncbi:8838_t:CDS:2 [Ambispora gerdemannii]|uniref:8838_t:CDS:1 n=1 Tax=Ambispora gerdemannii TaxID=144530 RepID=A0A9N9C4D6_9GLOM|nr:8838_t:CDS:2 [Ambispora gerdemannii]
MHALRNNTYVPVIHSPLASSSSAAQLPTPPSSFLSRGNAQSRISSRYTSIVKPTNQQRFNGKKFRKECAERIKASRALTVSQRREGLSDIQGVVDAEQSIQQMWMQFQKQHALYNLWYEPEDYEELLQEISQESLMYEQQHVTKINNYDDMMIDDKGVDDEKEIEFALMMNDEEYLINDM